MLQDYSCAWGLRSKPKDAYVTMRATRQMMKKAMQKAKEDPQKQQQTAEAPKKKQQRTAVAQHSEDSDDGELVGKK